MRISMRLCSVLVLVLAACGGNSESSTTEAATEAPAATEDAGGGSTTTTSAAPATTTTTEPPSTTTTTEQSAPAGDAAERAQARVDAVAAAAPEGWTTTIDEAAEVESDQDVLYETCLGEGDFDLNDLDGASIVALLAEVAGPTPQGGFLPPPEASIEVRVMESEAVARDAFSVFSELYGSEDGVECVTSVFIDEMGQDLPTEEFSLEVSRELLDDADAGVQFSMAFEMEGFSAAIAIDFQGALVGDTIVVGTFFTFGEPFDPDIANTLFGAAVNG